MVRLVWFMGAALLALAVTSSAAEAQTQTAKQSTIHARTTHRRPVVKAKEGAPDHSAQGNPFWLTLGRGASVGHGNNYVTETFDQPSPVEGMFSGYRGRERLINRYGVPSAPLFQF